MNECKYKVKPLPNEFCVGCSFNGCYPWNTNPLLLCTHMGGLYLAVIEAYESGGFDCVCYVPVTEDSWMSHLTDLKTEAKLNERSRQKAIDGEVYSSEPLPAESLELKKDERK